MPKVIIKIVGTVEIPISFQEFVKKHNGYTDYDGLADLALSGSPSRVVITDEETREEVEL